MSFRQAIEKGNQDMAKIHAENSIRQKNQAINFLKSSFSFSDFSRFCNLCSSRLSSRMEAVSQRVEASRNMQSVLATSLMQFEFPILFFKAWPCNGRCCQHDGFCDRVDGCRTGVLPPTFPLVLLLEPAKISLPVDVNDGSVRKAI